jgi:uncharacterized membrane protein YfcA
MFDDLLLFVAVGFAAQLVDGALGMAYGLSATSVLLGFGIPPATASASVHAAEVFTTAASGASHWRFGNVDFKLLRRLALPGMLGGAAGAYVLAGAPIHLIRPAVNLYLLAMGGVILWRALRLRRAPAQPARHIGLLGLFGGFLDAVGGGWGAVVTSSLIGRGVAARQAVGTTSLSELFVAATVSATFFATIGFELWPVIAGLILGGVLAAPFAAYAVRRMPDRPLMILVAVLIMLLSLRGLLQLL